MAVLGQDRLGCENANRTIWQRYLHPSKAWSLLSSVFQQGPLLRISATEFFKHWTEITQGLQMFLIRVFGIDDTALWAVVELPLNSVSGIDIDGRGIKLMANYISHMLRVVMGPQEKYFKDFIDVVGSEDYEAQWFSHESYSHSMMPF